MTKPRIWFTSDTHLGHKNIITYCKRPFVTADGQPDVDLMDTVLIGNWNERVRDEDIIFHMGDFAFGGASRIRAYAEQLKGRKILLRGNHDRHNDKLYRDIGFEVHRSLTIGAVRMQHRPPKFLDQRMTAGCYLVGHVHERWASWPWATADGITNIVAYNVGVDVRHFRPVSLAEIGEDDSLLGNFEEWL